MTQTVRYESGVESSDSRPPSVRNFLTLCLSGQEKKARRLIPQLSTLGFYQTGEKQDERFSGVWRFYFSIRSEHVQ